MLSALIYVSCGRKQVFEMQKLRDNPECAEQEYALKTDDENPGLHVKLSFDLNEDVAAPYILKGAKTTSLLSCVSRALTHMLKWPLHLIALAFAAKRRSYVGRIIR